MMRTTSETAQNTPRLFVTRTARGRLLYKLYVFLFAAWVLCLFYYRYTHAPGRQRHRLLWLAVSLAELWFAVAWALQQALRWAPTFHTVFHGAHEETLSSPAVDVIVCAADPAREPPGLVANTLLSLMAYDYDVRRMAFFLSDDGGSELTFHAAVLAAEFARGWLPFCRRHGVEPRVPEAYFSPGNPVVDSGGRGFLEEYGAVKRKFEEMQERIAYAGATGKVPVETRKEHKGFKAWDLKIDPQDHESIVEVLLRGNGEDQDVDGQPMPTLVYVSREKRPGQPHHFKAGALNALNRVSELMSNAPFILNVDCDMYSNNAQALHHAMCFFLDPVEGNQIGYVQFPQSFSGITKYDLYANSNKRAFEIEFFGFNAFNGPPYAGTGSIHRRNSLNGMRFTPNYLPKYETILGREKMDWSKLEERAKNLVSCTFEVGKPWGKEVGLIYGCQVEDLLTGMAIQLKGWRSVYYSPEREAYLGLGPVNVNDTLIQHKRWATGLFDLFTSDYCPLICGVGRLKLGQIMCYSFYTLWALWCFPVLCYGLLPCLAMVNGISLFPQVKDPWFLVFAFLGTASHAFSLGELLWYKGTTKMWWNETRMQLMKATSSYLFSLGAVILKMLGLCHLGFEVTSKVMDEEAMENYGKEVMEFGVASPMFIPFTTLSLLNLFSILWVATKVIILSWEDYSHLAMQMALSAYVSLISLPIYEAMFLRQDKGSLPISITLCSILICLFLLWFFNMFV